MGRPGVKVEKILKGSLGSIPSPLPVKIQIMGGKVCLRCKGKTLLGDVNKLFVKKSVLVRREHMYSQVSIKRAACLTTVHCI